MMLKILNSREKKRLADRLAAEYGTGLGIFDGYDVMEGGGDVWVASRECLTQDLSGLKVDSLGLQVVRGGVPTIHGVQMLFKSAKATELDESEAKTFLDGRPIGRTGKIMSYRGHPLGRAVEAEGGSMRSRD